MRVMKSAAKNPIQSWKHASLRVSHRSTASSGSVTINSRDRQQSSLLSRTTVCIPTPLLHDVTVPMVAAVSQSKTINNMPGTPPSRRHPYGHGFQGNFKRRMSLQEVQDINTNTRASIPVSPTLRSSAALAIPIWTHGFTGLRRLAPAEFQQDKDSASLKISSLPPSDPPQASDRLTAEDWALTRLAQSLVTKRKALQSTITTCNETVLKLTKEVQACEEELFGLVFEGEIAQVG